MFSHIPKSLRHGALNNKETRRRFAQYYKTRIAPLKAPKTEILDLNSETQDEALLNSVAPLWNMPYEDQLKLKDQWITLTVYEYLNILENDLFHSKAKSYRFTPKRPNILSMYPSPVIRHYRNTDKFVVHTGIDGNPKTVGHIIRSNEQYFCVPPTDILSPPYHSTVVQAFQDYIRSSALPACHYFSKVGNWKELEVRSNALGETMAVVKIHPQQLTKAEIEDECVKLKEYFENGPGSVCHLSSLFFQSSPTSEPVPHQLLFGNKYLMEKLSGRDFALSPGSFFQRNLKVAEILYDKIVLLAGLSPSSTILDLGCGIGTVSIIASPYVRGTVGIDTNIDAINDAKYNAQLNNNFSAEFMVGSIEKKLQSAIKLLEQSSDIVAILNPGRCGVNVSAIELLRETPQIGKVIYVSCQPDHEWVIRNVGALLKPETKRKRGMPFTFKSVIPVDMFPHTTHCELIMKFER